MKNVFLLIKNKLTKLAVLPININVTKITIAGKLIKYAP